MQTSPLTSPCTRDVSRRLEVSSQQQEYEPPIPPMKPVARGREPVRRQPSGDGLDASASPVDRQQQPLRRQSSGDGGMDSRTPVDRKQATPRRQRSSDGLEAHSDRPSNHGTTAAASVVRRVMLILLLGMFLHEFFVALDVRKSIPCYLSSSYSHQSRLDQERSGSGGGLDLNSFYISSVATQRRTFHVLYGLSGSIPEFMNEFDVSLKSVLMNAPLDSDMDVHLIVDAEALPEVRRKIRKAGLANSVWRNQISIYLYLISEEAKTRYEEHVLEALPVKNITTGKRVGPGGLFRLFAYEILPKSVRSVAYLDNDVVILTKLDELSAVRDDRYMYQVGVKKDVCSGLMIINLQRFHEFWDYLRRVHPSRIPTNSGRIGDQLILQRVKDLGNNELKERLVGDLPREWHVHLAHGFRRRAHLLRKKRPRFGMLHFNGRRGNHEEWWKGGIMKYCMEGECANNIKMQEDFRQTWMLAEHYVTIPWTNAMYLAKGHAGERAGKKIRIEKRCPANEESCTL